MLSAVASVADMPERRETVLVIDHAPGLEARTRERFPDGVGRVRVLANTARRGLSGARNTGVLAAEGEYLAFLDDDAAARPGWLAALLAPMLEDPNVLGVGGRAEPVWPGSTSRRLPPELLWVVGCSHEGLPEQRAAVRNVIGCSMLFRRSALLEARGFDLDTGRVGSVPLGCEETELCIRLADGRPGTSIVLEPSAVVDHLVTAERTTGAYLRRRGYREGVSKAILARRHGAGPALSSERAYLREVLPRAVRRELGRLGRGGGRATLAIGTAVLMTGLGYLRGRLAGTGGPISHDPRFEPA